MYFWSETCEFKDRTNKTVWQTFFKVKNWIMHFLERIKMHKMKNRSHKFKIGLKRQIIGFPEP